MEPNNTPLNPQPEASSQAPKSIVLRPKAPLVVGALVLMMVASVGSAVYFFNQYKTTSKLLKNPNVVADKEVKSLVAQLGKIMELPNENPTVATVADISKLKGQAFFTNAQNGDKVLIYANAREAILYRPKDNKIIQVAPVNIGQTAAQQTTQNNGSVAGAQTTVTPSAAVSPTKAVTPSVKPLVTVTPATAKP